MARLRRLFNLAVEWELLHESPMAGMKFLRENNARTRYLSLEEWCRLIASCIAPHIRAIVTLALHSGMRLGEILNLCWQDLDFHASFMLVRDSKNGEARHVPMDRTLANLFCRYPRRAGTDLIFSNSSGSRLIDIRTGFQKACARAGISDLHFHDLRHTFASHFMMAGSDLWILRGILGHKTVQMTLRYSHMAPSFAVKAIDRMNTLWEITLPSPKSQEDSVEEVLVTIAPQPLAIDRMNNIWKSPEHVLSAPNAPPEQIPVTVKSQDAVKSTTL